MTSQDNCKCPDFEIVSAYFDNELDKGSPEALHIASCPLCAAHLETLGRMDAALKNSVAEAVPSGMEERVLAGVRKKLLASGRREPIPFPGAFLLKVAAGLALMAGVGLLFQDFFVSKRAGDDVAVEIMLPKSRVLDSGDAIPLQSMRPVNFVEASMASEGRPAVRIEDQVRHVWSCDKCPNPAAKLREVALSLNMSPGAIVKNNLGWHVSCSLPKKDLAMLVRKCRESGFTLLNDQPPRPEHSVFSGSGADRVDYIADFVRGK